MRLLRIASAVAVGLLLSCAPRQVEESTRSAQPADPQTGRSAQPADSTFVRALLVKAAVLALHGDSASLGEVVTSPVVARSIYSLRIGAMPILESLMREAPRLIRVYSPVGGPSRFVFEVGLRRFPDHCYPEGVNDRITVTAHLVDDGLRLSGLDMNIC